MKEELNYDQRRAWARAIYTTKDKSVRDVALEVEVDEATMRNWIDEGAWDGVRRSSLISKTTQIERFYGQIEKINARIDNTPDDVNTKDVDLILKYTAAIKNLEADISLCQVIEVSESFIAWLRRKDVAFTKEVMVRLDAFVKHKIAAA